MFSLISGRRVGAHAMPCRWAPTWRFHTVLCSLKTVNKNENENKTNKQKKNRKMMNALKTRCIKMNKVLSETMYTFAFL